MKVKTLIDEIRFINTHIKENKGVFTIDVKKLNSILNYIDELEEENKQLKELNVCVGCNNNPDYKSRIDKAIEYIGSITDVKVRYFNYREFEKQGLHISHEELKKRIKEQKLEGQYIEIDRDDILKILKGEE